MASEAPPADPTAEGYENEESGPRRRDRWYTTGEMARLSNNTLRTVRFYEEAGILQPVGRTEGGHRLFARTELDRLMLVTDMREAGLSLEEIRTLLESRLTSDDGREAARSAIDTLRHYMEELQRKVEILTRLHDDFFESVDVAARSLECPHQTVFPSRCPLCDGRREERPLPRALRVLWSRPPHAMAAPSDLPGHAQLEDTAEMRRIDRSGEESSSRAGRTRSGVVTATHGERSHGHPERDEPERTPDAHDPGHTGRKRG